MKRYKTYTILVLSTLTYLRPVSFVLATAVQVPESGLRKPSGLRPSVAGQPGQPAWHMPKSAE
jgi:hypothetical protein